MNKDEVYSEFISRVIDNKIESALDVVRLCMEVVDKKDINGPDKSVLVYACIQSVIEEDPKPESLTDAIINDMRFLLDTNILQQTMTAIVDAAKGKFDISKPYSNQRVVSQPVYIRKWGAQLWGY
jgi:hypothetical protein